MITPRELDARLKGAEKRLRREHNDRAWLAWHAAALPRARRFPKLDSLTIKPESKQKAEDPGERVNRMSAIAMMWHAQAKPKRR